MALLTARARWSDLEVQAQPAREPLAVKPWEAASQALVVLAP